MGPAEVLSHVMRSLQQGGLDGCTALLGFSLKPPSGGGVEDFLGQVCGWDCELYAAQSRNLPPSHSQVQPGFYASPQELLDYLLTHERYATLCSLSEFKPMGPPEYSDMARRAAAKLLVRRDGRNWEDFFVNLELVDLGAGAPAPKRWLITTIFKQGVAQ